MTVNKYPQRSEIAQKAAQKKTRRVIRLAYTLGRAMVRLEVFGVGMGYAETKRLGDGIVWLLL